jgi:hypothetical protein
VGWDKVRGYILVGVVENSSSATPATSNKRRDAAGQTDDRERAFVSRQHGARAQDHAKAAAVEELNVAKIEYEHSDAVANRCVNGSLEVRYDGNVDLAPNR